jgi:hypothetical protein
MDLETMHVEQDPIFKDAHEQYLAKAEQEGRVRRRTR